MVLMYLFIRYNAKFPSLFNDNRLLVWTASYAIYYVEVSVYRVCFAANCLL